MPRCLKNCCLARKKKEDEKKNSKTLNKIFWLTFPESKISSALKRPTQRNT